jgi:sec-independent protein translocase protein TatA
MFSDLFSGPHIIIILAIVVLLFGATRLPALAKALGQSGRIFKSEMKAGKADDAATTSETTPVAAEDTSIKSS